MTSRESITRAPKEGDYARLDEPGGSRVLCHRRLPGDRYCRHVVAEIEPATDTTGRQRRLVRLLGGAWNEERGIWRLDSSDKRCLKAGLPPRRQATVGPQRLVWETVDPDWLAFWPLAPSPSRTPRCPRSLSVRGVDTQDRGRCWWSHADGIVRQG